MDNLLQTAVSVHLAQELLDDLASAGYFPPCLNEAVRE
jgi:hypothetical protein